MLWVFVIIGLISSGTALYRLAAVLRTRRRALLVEIGVLILLVAAWIAGHTTAIGWIALLGAFGIELLHFAGAPRPHKKTSRRTPPSTGNVTELPVLPPQPAAGTNSISSIAKPGPNPPSSIRKPLSFTTISLLRGPWDAAGGVFLASLHRAGRRSAELSPNRRAGDRIELDVDNAKLELMSVPSPVEQARLGYAASQSWDWPQAAETVARHSAHVAITTRSDEETPLAEIVHLHYQAHAALAEFTPVLAVLWPDAGRLVPKSALLGLCQKVGDGSAQAACCVNYRVYSLEGEDAGCFVSDTVGLHAFGLPDVQIITDGEPDESISAVVYELADRFFTAGWEIKEGDSLSIGDAGRWRATITHSRFAPHRDVIELSAITQDTPEDRDSSNGAPQPSDS